ncbi:MAG: hypothetical protein QOK37_4222 [Thermoanaerobaculia bacterium]|jgi:hypothetical protein|nr:hypothetical protein [Thermoanaerobaculia bacterium]
MFNIKTIARNSVLAGAATLLLGSSAFAQYGPTVSIQLGGYNRIADRGYANRVVEGQVASVGYARNGQRVRLTNGMDVVIPNSMNGLDRGRRYGASTLLPGDLVRMTVYSREGDGRDARVVSYELLQSGRNSNYSNGRRMNGTIVSMDRRNRTMIVETDNGRQVSVDLNAYSGRNGNGYNGFRRGDRVSMSGRNDRGTFIIDDIQVSNNDQYDQYGHRR